ncbi:MAG: FkbM family methyltransferase, partial [Pseudomonadota bacterium]
MTATTLDELCASGGVPLPDVIKIDVEGFEAAVLEGMRSQLRARQPQLCIELHGEDVEDKILKTRSVLQQLQSAGYEDVLHVESGRSLRCGTEVGFEFSQGHLLVGGERLAALASRSHECTVKRGWRASQRRTVGVSCVRRSGTPGIIGSAGCGRSSA